MVPIEFNKRFNQLGGFALALAVVFCLTLFRWVRYALADDLFSYTLGVPVVVVWLIWQDRDRLNWQHTSAPRTTLVLGLVALGFAAAGAAPRADGDLVTKLTLHIIAFVVALNAGAVWFLGGTVMRQLAFPAGFLLFMAPLPPVMLQGIESGLQHASADASAWLFALTGAPFFRHGLVFQLPGITIEVAPECSGIRSTLVLFMTSLIAGHLFLQRGWHKGLLTLLVIPLGIARNALRIVTIGWLCIEYGPQMIDSIVHRRGGPFFFAVSLVPLFLLLFWFRRLERRRAAPPGGGTSLNTAPTAAANP